MLDKETVNRIQGFVDDAMMQTDAIPQPAVNVEKMAKTLGFAVRRLVLNLPNVIGLMVIDAMDEQMKKKAGSDKLIALNNRYDEPHLRFAIAHEIGHYFMHNSECKKGTNPVYFTQIEDNEEGIEEEACRFAAMLLMDKAKFQEAYENLKSNRALREIDVIRELAQLFAVPQKAVQRRIGELADE